MIDLDIQGLHEVNNALSRLRLPPEKRRWVHGMLVRKVRVFSRARIRSQTNVDGSPWEPRKRETKSKMMAGLSRRMRARGGHSDGVVDWVGGKVARFQQEGGTEKWNAAKAARRYGDAKKDMPASRLQGIRLRELGYKIRRGRGWKSPNLKWITSNMTMQQASFMIRTLSNQSSVSEWETKTPGRSFLGVTPEEQQALLSLAMNAMLKIKG
jgi:hypothetical protein